MTDLALQASLFGGGEPAPDGSFGVLVRHDLGRGAWVDHAPAWLAGADRVFDDLLAAVAWRQSEVTMYERQVVQPRLTAWWQQASGGEPFLRPLLAEMAAYLGERYGVAFDSVGLNLYRDGHDSVAWHGDRHARARRDDAVVAIVSVGAPRRFLLRPAGGGRSRAFELGGGDLLVMGGSCQRTWQHCVPKVAAAGPRISISYRHPVGIAAEGGDRTCPLDARTRVR